MKQTGLKSNGNAKHRPEGTSTYGFREIEFLRAFPERQARTTDGEAEMLIHRWFCHCEKTEIRCAI